MGFSFTTLTKEKKLLVISMAQPLRLTKSAPNNVLGHLPGLQLKRSSCIYVPNKPLKTISNTSASFREKNAHSTFDFEKVMHSSVEEHVKCCSSVIYKRIFKGFTDYKKSIFFASDRSKEA